MRHEVAMAKMATEGVISTRAQIESERARVQSALALAGEQNSNMELLRGRWPQ